MKKHIRPKIIIITIFIGLLLHFIIHTVITYKLWIKNNIIWILWMRKELIIILLSAWLLFYYKKIINILKRDKQLRLFTIMTLSVSVFLFAMQYLNYWEIFNFIISYKYIIFAFIIFLVITLRSKLFPKKISFQLTKTILSIIQILLIISILRYLSLLLIPQRLELLGYNLHIDNITRTANTAPQWLYKTQMRTWNIRNQWIFSWPLSRGFFLMLIRPRFVSKLEKTKLNSITKYIRYIIFTINIYITFTRSAQWVWILQTIILLAYYRKWLPKFKRKHLLWISGGGVIIAISSFMYLFSTDKISRKTSDWWHIEFMLKGISMIQQKPIIWHGAGSAWPASYYIKEKQHFNPENQYLQLAIEYWLFWLLARLTLFISFPILLYKKTWDISWLISRMGIALAWLVLHSFSDTMALYLFMMIAGLSYNKVKQIKLK